MHKEITFLLKQNETFEVETAKLNALNEGLHNKINHLVEGK